jgi:DNA segregation ATPase FtsK/SpoIIIE-like protein
MKRLSIRTLMVFVVFAAIGLTSLRNANAWWAGITMLQRVLQIGYGRAGKLIDAMEHEGIVGGWTKMGQPRKVRVKDAEKDVA